MGLDPPHLKNHKNIEFLSNTGPDPLKNHKATRPAFSVERSSARHGNSISIIDTPGKGHLNGILLVGR